MGTRSVASLLLATLAIAACGEQQQPESMAGPSLAGGRPVDAAACDPNALNSLITAYFPGGSANVIKTYKDAMVAAPNTTTARTNGFAILDSIGSLSRQILDGGASVDLAAGSQLAQGVVKCMFDAKSFTPTFPTNAIYNFAPALDAVNGGAFYTRGAGTGGSGPVQAVLPGITELDVQSGVAPLGTSTWTSTLAGNTGSEGRVLIYGYRTNNDPFTYEWATIPPATTFAPGATVALCNGDASNLMIHEANIGVLAFQGAAGICAAPYSVVIKDTGWGPRALAARLARVVVDALQPAPLQATTLGKSGTGGTATTFKSQFHKEVVDTVTLKFTDKPKSVLKLQTPDTVEVRATTPIDGVVTGVNGVCIYLAGSNNNGTNTSLTGAEDPRCKHVDSRVNAYTESKNLQAGFATLIFQVTKTGGLTTTATATDDNNSNIGAVGRNGQVFLSDAVKSNVKP